MNDENVSERAVALVNLALDWLRRAENAPASPVSAFLPAKRRRTLRRDAARLRQGKVEPRYGNLHTADELADLYERTVQRDEMFERAVADFHRIAPGPRPHSGGIPLRASESDGGLRPRGAAVGGGTEAQE